MSQLGRGSSSREPGDASRPLPPPGDHGGEQLFVGIFVTGLAAYMLAIITGKLSAAIWTGHVKDLPSTPDAVTIFSHLRNPSLAWARVFPSWFFWLILAIELSVVGCATFFVCRLFKGHSRRRDDDSTRVAGLADRHEVKAAAGAKNLLAKGSILRPGAAKPEASDLGFLLGTSRRVDCYATVEDSMVILGPPRSGKGYNLVIPFILDAPGAVVTTSTRPDNLAATITARSGSGPVGVFDPQGLAKGAPSGLRWSPIRGCADPQTAMMRAGALCAGASRGLKDANYWQQQTEVVVRCLLQAAAIDGRSISDVYRWSLSPDEAKEAVEILKTSSAATPLWGSALGAVVGLESRPRANIWSVVSGVFTPLGNPRVIEQLSPGSADEFQPATFLRQNGSLYLLGTSSGASATANFVSALIEDIVETARQIASASVGARLDPPLALVLDEAANYPLPSLGALMSEGGGSGITTIAVLQSLAQVRDRWGNDQAQAIWDSATSKIILGGSSNASDLRDLTQLIGERDSLETTTTRQAGGGQNVSESTRQRSILDPSMIRLIKSGHALLMLRSAKPIMLTLRPWTARSDRRLLKTQRRQVEETLRAGAQEDASGDTTT